jgi:FkbM family methyltransferase
MRNKVLHSFRGRTPEFDPQIILDVGANIGQSSAEFREHCPRARIIALEPIAAAFATLEGRFATDPQVQSFQVALGRANGTSKMVSNGASTGNHIVAATAAGSNIEDVKIAAGDSFCRDLGIDQIDFLKIDTEGHEIDVIVGFSEMLRLRKIDFIQVECGLAPENTYHVPFSYVSAVLFSYGYRLWGLFGLSHRMPRLGTRRGALFGDAVFVRETAL